MLSEPPMARLWHELQEMKPDLESRGSKNSFLPSSAMPRLMFCAGRMGLIGSLFATSARAATWTTASTASATAALRWFMSIPFLWQ